MGPPTNLSRNQNCQKSDFPHVSRFWQYITVSVCKIDPKYIYHLFLAFYKILIIAQGRCNPLLKERIRGLWNLPLGSNKVVWLNCGFWLGWIRFLDFRFKDLGQDLSFEFLDEKWNIQKYGKHPQCHRQCILSLLQVRNIFKKHNLGRPSKKM